MPFTNSDDLIAGQRNGQRPQLVKASQTSEGVGTFHSLWKALGYPVAGANPPLFSAGSGYVPTKDTAGAITFSNPTAPAITVMSLLEVYSTVLGQLLVCDRLWACSGFGTVITTLQSITTPGNLPAGRDPNTGGDVIPFLEIYGAPGATGATWTVTGTDALGNTNRTWQYTHPANAESVGQLLPLLPGGASPASTLGMRQAVSFQASGTSGTAGDIGISLLRRIAGCTVRSLSDPGFKDYAQLGMPRVYDDACLMMRVLCSAATTGRFEVDLQLAQN